MQLRGSILAAAALALATAGACSASFPDPVSGQQTLLVITYAPTTKQYQLTPTTIDTLHDLRTMTGDAAKVVSGGSVNASYMSIMTADPMTAASLQSLVVPNAGGPVDFNFFDVSGAAYPADADSLNMATIYANVERAYLLFQPMMAQLPQVPVYYGPSVSVTTDAVASVTDLGVSDPALNILFVPSGSDPSSQAMQPGVIAYQYSADVFQMQAFGAAGPTMVDTGYASDPTEWATTMSLVRSFRAGFADFFSAVANSDPDFVHTTGTTSDPNRALDPPMPRCLSTTPITLTQTRDMYDPHPLGSILSSTLWQIYSTRHDVQDFPQDVTAAMKAFGAEVQSKGSSLTLAESVAAVISAMSDVQADACNYMLDRFSLNPVTDVPACTTPPEETTCSGT